MSKTVSGATVGIDLGTTNSCVAYYNDNGEVQIITNDQGYRTTPSFVTYTEDERLVGNASKNVALENIENTVFGAKRLIGHKFNDDEVQEDIKHLPYVVEERNQQPMIKVKYLGKNCFFRPEEVSSVILEYLKDTAEKAIGKEVKNAVITVPAYFNDSQRQATRDAGRLAGLNVLRIINEPTAAAMAYGLGKKTNSVILVFDLGGGTFDVSLLSISDDNMFKVLATAGDTHLGGEDFDNVISKYLAQLYHKETNIDIRTNRRAMHQVRVAAEAAKRTLSSGSQATINLSHIGAKPFSCKLSRAKFNELCSALFKKCLDPIDCVLKDASKSVDDVDEIVVVGGSSRIPKIQELLKEHFKDTKTGVLKVLNLTVNPDEAVAHGAALQGALLSGLNREMGILLVDVAPLTLGVETYGGIMDPIIPRQKTVPCKKTKEYYTAKDNQTSVLIKVFEGERKMTDDNNKLGEFELSGIPPKPRGKSCVAVSFSLDSDGILSVSAEEHSTGAARTITITNNKGRLTSDELEAKIKEAEQYKKQDKEKKNRVKETNESEEYLYAVRDSESKLRGLTDKDKKELEDICSEGLDWLSEKAQECSGDDIRNQRHEWEKRVMVVYNRANASGQYNVHDEKTKDEPDTVSSNGNGNEDDDGPTVEDVEDEDDT
jgi:chaperone protein DnaK